LNASERNVHFLGTKEDIEDFKKWLEENRASKVVDENGEPLVVYHGTFGEFTKFDFEKLGETTGQGYYTDHITGERIPFDSTYAFFFTDNENAAYSYRNLAIYQQNQFRAKVYNNLAAIFSNKADLFTKFDGKEKEEQRNFIDNVVSPFIGFDVRRESNAIIKGTSTLSEKQKSELADRFMKMALKIKRLPEPRAISNQRANLSEYRNKLKWLINNKDNIINGKYIPAFEEKTLSITSNYGDWNKGDVYLTIAYRDGKYEILGLTRKAGDW